MVLTIDVGNTNTVMGVFGDKEKLLFDTRIETNSSRMADEYVFILMNALALHKVEVKAVTGAIVSSVVPPASEQIKNAVKKLFGIEAMLVGPGVKTGLNIRIDDPATLGADLCCAGVAVKEYYPLPCIIIDLGTATKVLAVNDKGDFLGGAIAVGVKMALDALSANTAALPLISTGRVEKAIGTNTVDCMRSGAILGMACMLDGFIERFEAEIGPAASIVATGGLSGLIAPCCKHDITLDPELLLKGLMVIYNRNRK